MDGEDEQDDGPTARVQEAACAERVIVLKVRVPGRTSYVIVGAGRAGFLAAETRRALWGGRLPPGAARQRHREDALHGAEVVALGPNAAYVEQGGLPRVVRADATRVVVTDGAPGADAVLLAAIEVAPAEEHGAAIAQAVAAEAVATVRAEALRLLERGVARIERRRQAIGGDLAKIAQADTIAAQAQWLVAEAKKAKRGATRLVVTDWSSGEPVPLEVPLDPSKSPKDQVAAMFKRAKRLRLGARIAEERLALADGQLAAVTAAQRSIEAATALLEIDALLKAARRAAPRDVSLPAAPEGGSRERSGKKTRIPHRTFFARSGGKVLVGKGAADNDQLTLHVARPHDLWLHAKDRTGAHVIVPLEKGQTCPAEDLVDGAHLAAHFSEARGETVVDVQYTDRRYVRKPKGSAPGLVVVDREKVLVLRVEPDVLRGLLEREDV